MSSEENDLARDELDEESADLDDAQKRRLRAVRRGYRAAEAIVKNNGWEIEIRYLDGSSVTVNSKMLKLRASDLTGPN